MAVNFSGSLVATGSIISTTGFTGSLSGTASNATTASSADDFLVRGTLTAQTINVQTITSSVDFVTGSSVNGSLLTNTHQFTGSVGVTGSLAINGVDYNSTSASFDTRITNTSSSLATLTTNNTIASASFDTRVNANSSSIVQLSGSYLTDSASFSTRVTTNSASISQLSSSYLAASASFETKINIISSSYATTGSNIFKGDQTITGSLLVSGSTTQIGNNTLTGNTTLSGSIAISGSQTFTGVATQIGNSYFTGSMNISGSTTQVGNNSLLGNTTLSGSITISGSHLLTSPSIKLYGDTETDGAIKFLPVADTIDNSITGSYIYVSGSTQDLYFTQNGAGFANTTRLRWLEGNLYTGLLNGGLITAATGSTTFNVSSGSGIIVNLNASITNNPYPTIQYVNWGNLTSQSLTYLTSSIQTFVGINSSGSVVQQTNAFNDGQYNTIITIGTVLHQNKSTVNASITYPNVAYGYKQRTYDFLKAFGPLKLSGLTINTSGSLGLTVGSGTAFAEGRNYQVDPNNPSYIIDTGTSVSKIFRYYQSGSEFVQDTNNGAGYTVIDPANYNNNGTLTGVNPSTPYTIQRVFWYPNSATKGIVVYYGSQQYASSTEAIANVAYETFTEVENTKQNAVYLGAIVIRYNGVFTNPGDYNILPSGLFRNIGGSGGGGGTVTSRLIDLSDVAVSGPTNGQPLAYDTTAGKWINASTISASLAGNATTATSASYAATASFVQTAQTASFVLNAVSSSFANTASYAVTASYVLGQSPTASHALTASSADNFLVRGTLTAQTINAQTVSSSIVYSSGSNIFGDATNDNHRFTGSILISGSLITNTPITGSSITGSFTGSLSGIASQASTLLVTTSSVSQDYSLAFAPSGADGYVQFYTDGGKDVLYNPSTNILQARNIVALNSISGSLTGSLTGTASYATQAITASFVTTAQTASYVLNAVSASFATNATGAFVQGGNSFGAAALIGTNDAQNLTLETNNTNRIFISSSGYTGIGGITSPAATIPQARLDVNGIIRARSGFQIMSDTPTTVLSSSRSDNTQVGILTFNGWGDYAFNQSLLIGYAPQASQYGTGNLFVSNRIGVGKSGSNTQLDVLGNILATGSITATTGFTGSLQGTATTASFVQTAQTASFVLNAVSSSFATTSSYIVTAQTASYVLNAVSASYAISSSRSDNSATASSVNTLVQDVTITGSLLATGTLTANGNLISANSSGDEGGEILLSKPQTNNTLTGSGVTIDVYQNRLRFFEQGGAARGAYIDISTLGAGVSTNLLGTATSASIAQTASYVETAQTASYVQTAQTASYVLNAISASYAATASYANNFTVAGTLTAQTINVQTITSSIEFNTGSTRNGSLLTNTHEFTGSVLMTGSLAVSGSLTNGGGGTDGRFLVQASTNSEWFSVGVASTGTVRFNSGGGTTLVAGASSVGRMNIGSLSTSSIPLSIQGIASQTGDLLRIDRDNSSTNGSTFLVNASGSVGIGSTTLTGFGIRNSKTITGATTAYAVHSDGVIQSDVTGNAFMYNTQASTAATSFTLTNLNHFRASQGTIGAGSAITNQYGFVVDSSVTGATNNYGYFGNIANGSGRWNLYMAGTANNYLAGNLLIGTTSDNTYKLQVSGSDATLNGVRVGKGGGDLVNNTVVGASSLGSNTTGISNTVVGYASLGTNSTGNENTIIGSVSLNNHTATSGNSTLGYTNLSSVTTGSYNTAIGGRAGRYAGTGSSTPITSVSYGIFLGYQSRALNAIGDTNEIVIGNDVVGLGSNTTVIGNSSTTATAIYGDLLLGTTTDNGTHKLQVSGSAIITGSLTVTQGITGSLSGTASFATSASYAATSSFANNLTVAGTLTAQTINVQTITSSIEFNTGSTRNGSTTANTHEFTGSVSVTGSLNVAGNILPIVTSNIGSGGTPFNNGIFSNIVYAGTLYGYSAGLNLGRNGVTGMRIHSLTNNIQLQDGGTFTDNGYRLQINGSGSLSGSLFVSGSSVFSGSVTSTLGFTGSLLGTASVATSSSFAATSSYSNDFTIGGTLTFDGTLTDYNTVASSIVGTNNIFTKSTGSYTSAFIKYTVTSGSNARSGEVMTVWNGTSTQYVDNSTLDIGDTSPVVISTSIVTSQIQINAATSNSGWRIKAIGTFI